MFGLDMVMAGWVVLASNKIECESPQKPKVSVIPSNSTVKYNFETSRDVLQTFEIDTISPYGPEHETHLNGVMRGSIQLETKIKYLSQQVSPDLSCLYVDEIHVNIHFDPEIFVASELPQGTCQHEAVLEHEKKHLKIDKLIINKYTDRISKTLAFALKKYGAAFGPYPSTDVPVLYDDLKDYFVGIVQSEEERMVKDRQRLQQGIDTLEEYERVANLCR